MGTPFILSFMGTLSTAVTLMLILYIVFFFLRYANKAGLYIFGFIFVLLNLFDLSQPSSDDVIFVAM